MNWFARDWKAFALKLFASSRWLITSSTRLGANWHSSNLEVIKWLRTSGTITATYLRAIEKWCWCIFLCRMEQPGIRWLLHTRYIWKKLTNPTGINLLRWSNPKITSNALIYQAHKGWRPRQQKSSRVERRDSQVKRESQNKIMKRYYYSNEVLFLLWTEENSFCLSSIHLSTRFASFFLRMSHVYKRHEIWMSSFLFKRWYRIG